MSVGARGDTVRKSGRPLRLLIKQFGVPTEHGGWFLWIGPFLLGTLAAARPRLDLLLLLLLLLAGFLSRQPLVMLVKSLAGRRARADVVPALQVFAVLAVIALVLLAWLIGIGHYYLLWLAAPALPVLAWQLWLVARREERQIAIELMGTGVLALAAPAAYWVSLGRPETTGWWLWVLSWIYNASAVVFVYLRLTQRRWKETPKASEGWMQGRRAVLYASANLAITTALVLLGLVPAWVPGAYAFALAFVGYGILKPAVGARPTQIGVEQSTATLAFFLLLGLAYRV